VLAPPKRVSGRREYGREHANSLKLLLAAQRAGFTLAETRSLFALFSDERHASERWRGMAREKIVELDATIAHLRGARRTLRNALDCACAGDADSCKLVAVLPASKKRLQAGSKRWR